MKGLPVSTEAEAFLKKALFGSHKTLTTIIYIEATYDAPQWTATDETKDVLEETNAHQRAASRNSVAQCHHCARLPLLAR